MLQIKKIEVEPFSTALCLTDGSTAVTLRECQGDGEGYAVFGVDPIEGELFEYQIACGERGIPDYYDSIQEALESVGFFMGDEHDRDCRCEGKCEG